VIEMAYVEGATPPPIGDPVTATDGEISNGLYTVRAAKDSPGVHILQRSMPIFDGQGLGAITVEDPWGSWGGMAEERDAIHLNTIRHQWTITDVRILERGPLRAAMWVRMEGGNSRLDLTFLCSHARECVDVNARVFWNERSARLKLVLPAGDRAEFQVPGATVKRAPNLGQVPGGRWVRITGQR